jgi:transposase-like protein
MSAWSLDALRAAWVELAFSTDADDALRSLARRYGIAATSLDDLRQIWIVSLDATARRNPAIVDAVSDLDTARRYAFRALRNRALDHLRAAQSRAEEVAVASDDGTTVIDRTAGPDLVDDALLADLGLARVREEIGRRLREGEITCAGCRPAVVAQVSLAVVDAFAGAAQGQRVHLAGGTTELDELIYGGLRHALPGQVAFDEHGRADERTRQLKSRCGRCVRAVLAAALTVGSDRHTESASPAGTGMPSSTDHRRERP